MKQKQFMIEWEGCGNLTESILQRVLDRWLAYISFFNIRVYEIDKKVECEEKSPEVDRSVCTCESMKTELKKTPS